MWKACSKCGKIHDVNYKCNHDDIHKEEQERKLRQRYVWTKKSQEIREKANHLCEVCRDQNIYTYDNLEVHHIEKLRDRQDLFLDNENLVCLCSDHHKKADKGELDKEYLKKLALKREKNPPSIFFEKNF